MTKLKKHQRDKNTIVKEEFGKKALYIGMAGAFFKCNCGKMFKKGMISEYKGKMFCSERCVVENMN